MNWNAKDWFGRFGRRGSICEGWTAQKVKKKRKDGTGGRGTERNEESNADDCCKCDAKDFKFGVEVWGE